MKIIADIKISAFQFGDRQVVAEGAGDDLVAQFLRPPCVIRAAIDVDRLVRPAVMSLAGDKITGDAERANMNGTNHWVLVYPGGFQLWTVLLGPFHADVDTN